jgi:hypothetical protein
VTELPFVTRYRKRFDSTWNEDTPIDQVRFVVLDTETTGLIRRPTELSPSVRLRFRTATSCWMTRLRRY